MSLEFDEKGKFYTNVISKKAVPVIIQTTLHRIEGYVHVRLDGRLKDDLDVNEPFLAVTRAKVFQADGTLIQEASFLSITRAQIVWIMQVEDSTEAGETK